ncbi:MAG: hypothetical protein EB051_00870 [Chlamydiia bacterium]|nr:hypothetical protein [Chlamydiia bacterium]
MIKFSPISIMSLCMFLILGSHAFSIQSSNQALINAESFITFTSDSIPLDSYQNIQTRWALICSEQLAKKRLLVALESCGVDFGVYTGGRDFSPSSLSITILYNQDTPPEEVSAMRDKIDQALQAPIADEEYLLIQEENLNLLSHLKSGSIGEDGAYIYNCLEKEFLSENSPYNFIHFLALSYDSIEELRIDQFSSVFFSYFDSSHRIEEVFAPLENGAIETEDVDCDRDQENTVSGAFFLKPRSYSLQSLHLNEEGEVHEHPHFGSIEGYNQLRLTRADTKNIRSILTTMSDKNVLSLLLEKSSLEKKGKQIRPVHPMRFIGYILADPHLRKCLRNIKKDYFKWSNFVEGFVDRMKEENGRNNVVHYIYGLSNLIKVDSNTIYQFIHKKDYEGLLKHCM